jgi:hypothetical protein
MMYGKIEFRHFMATPPNTVIATARTVNDAFSNAESAGAVEELGHRIDPVEAASMFGLIGSLRESIEAAQEEVGPGLFACPHSNDPMARKSSVLLSMLAEGEKGTVKTSPTPDGQALEAKFDTKDWLGWMTVAWEKMKHWQRHKIPRPAVSIAPFPNRGRVGVVGDWGTNLYGAPKCRESIEKDAKGFAMLLHLGDVYYSGTAKEVTERFLNVWPNRNDASLIHRALNSNHEMYSGGDAYFGMTLKKFGQTSSYFAMSNDHWLLVGLDTAYGRESASEDHDLDDIQVKWVEGILDHPEADGKKVLFLSHHQLYSQFDSQGPKLTSRLGHLLGAGRVNAWLWAHEHHAVIYQPHPDLGGLKASCLGHGGMPDARTRKVTKLSVAESRQTSSGQMLWRSFDPLIKDGRLICPSGLVLDGENIYIKDEEKEFSPHGYAVLDFRDADLVEEIYTPGGTLIHERNLA